MNVYLNYEVIEWITGKCQSGTNLKYNIRLRNLVEQALTLTSLKVFFNIWKILVILYISRNVFRNEGRMLSLFIVVPNKKANNRIE